MHNVGQQILIEHTATYVYFMQSITTGCDFVVKLKKKTHVFNNSKTTSKDYSLQPKTKCVKVNN